MKKQLEKFEHMILRSFYSALAIVAAGVFTLNPYGVDAGLDFANPFVSYTEKPVLARSLPLSEGVREPKRSVAVVATAYTSTPEETDDTPFLSANGTIVYDGMIAANFLPFGTLVRFPEIDQDKIFRVDDRMNSRYGHGRIDIWMRGKSTAFTFGKQHLDMEIIGRQLH